MQVKTATGERFAVVAGHPLAAQAAAQMLEGGGNVVDAAIAGAAVLTVALPNACSLGGDCFALAHIGGATYGINGSGMSPAKLPRDATPQQLASGPLSCSVPGVLGAWEALQRRFGRSKWRALFDRAIELARGGVPVASELAGAMRGWLEPLQRDPGCGALFLRDGEPYAAGDTLRQSAFAETLSAVATEGAAVVYQGRIGRALCEGLRAAGSVLDPDDLAAYSPDWVEPLEYVYRGRAVRAMPPNSWGLYMLMQLAALEGIPPERMPRGSAARLAFLIRAARASFELGSRFVADPREAKATLHEALAPDMLRLLRQALSSPSTAAQDIPRSHGTAVISVADSSGEGVTIVQSVFMPFGSVMADKATGIVMNNRLLGFTHERGHPNCAAPAKRPAHTLNPVMVFEGNRLRFLMGTPGGSGQTLTLTQVLSNVLDHGMELAEAIAAPRWSMDLKGNLLLEPEIGDNTARELAALGTAAKLAPEQRSFFGSAECIDLSGGALTAAADFRRNAGAIAL